MMMNICMLLKPTQLFEFEESKSYHAFDIIRCLPMFESILKCKTNICICYINITKNISKDNYLYQYYISEIIKSLQHTVYNPFCPRDTYNRHVIKAL